jgi:hypothetical protein
MRSLKKPHHFFLFSNSTNEIPPRDLQSDIWPLRFTFGTKSFPWGIGRLVMGDVCARVIQVSIADLVSESVRGDDRVCHGLLQKTVGTSDSTGV